MFSGFRTAASTPAESGSLGPQSLHPEAYNGLHRGLQMPRFKPKGMLERNALADLWKHTLSQIPSTYGRLVYLASLRDPNSGIYRHHGLSAAFGREQSTGALRKSHEDTFWSGSTCRWRTRAADLIAHFNNVEENPARGHLSDSRGAVPEPGSGFRRPRPAPAISDGNGNPAGAA